MSVNARRASLDNPNRIGGEPAMTPNEAIVAAAKAVERACRLERKIARVDRRIARGDEHLEPFQGSLRRQLRAAIEHPGGGR